MAKGKGLDVKSLSLALAIPWSVGVFLVGLAAPYIGNWMIMVNWLGQFYVGYGASFLGSVAGGVWGFLDVFIGTYAIGWLYNYFHNKK